MTQIARDDLIEGARLAIANGTDYLESSLLSIDAGQLRVAAGSFALGIQEIGKAKMLADAYAAGDARPDLAIYSHEAKVSAARTVLGSSAMWLADPAFQPDAFQPNAFAVGTPADEPTRLEVTYVNYGSTGWKKPPAIDARALRGHIVDAIAVITTFEATLSTGGTVRALALDA